MQDIRIHRGDIFWVRQDYAAVGSEARKNRPAIIVSNEKNNTYSGTVEIVYLTTAEKKPMPTHVSIETMGKQSTALCEAIYTVDKERLENYYCTLTSDEMKLVGQAVLVSLGLTAPPTGIVAASQASESEKIRVPLNEPFGLEDAYRAIQNERDTLLAQKEIYEKICAAALPRWPKVVEVGT
nr:MAG TPA: PemK-like protein [Caudoviricetes sp.]